MLQTCPALQYCPPGPERQTHIPSDQKHGAKSFIIIIFIIIDTEYLPGGLGMSGTLLFVKILGAEVIQSPIYCFMLYLLWQKGGFHARKGSFVGAGISNIMIPPITDSFLCLPTYDAVST